MIKMATEAHIQYQRKKSKSYNKKYPYRKRATGLIRARVEKGKIVPPQKCFLCFTSESKRLVAHHENYAYPLEIDWLCDSCHKKHHDYLASIGWVDYIKRPVKKYTPNIIQPKDLEYVLDDETKQELNKLLASVNFTDREKEIIRLRATGNTLQEIGYIYGVTREAIRYNLAKAERKYDFAMKKA